MPLLCQQEQTDLRRLFEKYVPSAMDMIVDGIVDGKQTEKLKTVIPQTDLNMGERVSRDLNSATV